jgi:dihydrofolate synthase/folylpolyglutamate synthase
MALHPKLIDLSLGRIERLLAVLDHPERRLPPVVHVAGTNGKGSVIAYLRAALEAAGHRVHVYTSPHLVRFHERIRVAGRLIEEEHLAALLAECETANAGAPITFFEITTAAAFLAFAREAADVLLLESGLGGRLDATNVIHRPTLCVITPVSIDHTQYLGAGLAAIAGEKAGILKPGITAVIGPQPREAADVIAARAASLGAPLVRHGADFGGEAVADGMRYTSAGETMALPRPALPGAHQIANAATAIACLGQLPAFAVGRAQIAAGLVGVEWPARLQRLRRGPLVAALPAGWELWLDAGHNPAAGAALADVARTWRDRSLHLVVGLLGSKDAVGFLRPFAGLAEYVACVAIPGEVASRPAAEVAAAATAVELSAMTAEGVNTAVAGIVSAAPAPGRILICGSHYLVGKILVDNG